MMTKHVWGVLASGALWMAAATAAAQESPPSSDPIPGEAAPVPSQPGYPLADPTSPDPALPPAPLAAPAPPQATERTANTGLYTSPGRWEPRSRIGLAVLVGGGVADFANETVSRSTGAGGAWNLRITSGTRLPFAWEAAYVGGAHDVTGTGIGQDDYLVHNGAEASLRLNAPMVMGSALLAPFAAGGVGWNRYDLVNASSTTERLTSQDDQLVTPVALGLTFGYRGFTAEARGTYRFAFADDMFAGQDMSNWNASVGVGAEF
jgi:hypothetical protein